MEKYKFFGVVEKTIDNEVYKFKPLKNRERLDILSKFGVIDGLGQFKPSSNIFKINFEFIVETLIEAPLTVIKEGKCGDKLWGEATREERLEILDYVSDDLLNELSIIVMDLIGLSVKKN